MFFAMSRKEGRKVGEGYGCPHLRVLSPSLFFAMSAIIVLSLCFCSSSRSSCISFTVVFGINPSEAR